MSGGGPRPRALALLQPGQTVECPETGFGSAVGRLRGKGGFLQLYLGRRRGRSRDVPEVLCITVSTRIDGWQRADELIDALRPPPKAARR